MALFLQKRGIIYNPNKWIQTEFVYRPFEIDLMLPQSSDVKYPVDVEIDDAHHFKKRQREKDKYRDSSLMKSTNWQETRYAVSIPFNIIKLRADGKQPPWTIVRVPTPIIYRIFRGNYTMKEKKNKKLIDELDLLLYDAMNSTKPQRMFGKSWEKKYEA